MTNRAHYYVVYDGEWKIQCDGENSEPYRRRSDAFKDAVALAHLDVRNGREADVIVQMRGRSVSAGVGFDPRQLSAAAGARSLRHRATQRVKSRCVCAAWPGEIGLA